MHKIWLAFFLAAAVTATSAQNTVPLSVDTDKSALMTQSAVNSDATKDLLGRRNCLAETGSHIVRKDACINAAGRGYGRTAFDRTSTLGNTAEALEQLDTAVQIRVR